MIRVWAAVAILYALVFARMWWKCRKDENAFKEGRWRT